MVSPMKYASRLVTYPQALLVYLTLIRSTVTNSSTDEIQFALLNLLYVLEGLN